MAMPRRTDTGPSARQLRVGEELRHALARILERGELRDPVLAGVSVTVSEVRASPDLKRATVFVMPLGGRDIDPVVAALTRAAPYLRRLIAREVQLRYAPELTFRPDPSFAEANRIAALLREADAGRGGDAGHPADESCDSEPDKGDGEANGSVAERNPDSDDWDDDDSDGKASGRKTRPRAGGPDRGA